MLVCECVLNLGEKLAYHHLCQVWIVSRCECNMVTIGSCCLFLVAGLSAITHIWLVKVARDFIFRYV